MSSSMLSYSGCRYPMGAVLIRMLQAMAIRRACAKLRRSGDRLCRWAAFSIRQRMRLSAITLAATSLYAPSTVFDRRTSALKGCFKSRKVVSTGQRIFTGTKRSVIVFGRKGYFLR